MDIDPGRAIREEALRKKMARLRLLMFFKSDMIFWLFMALFIVGTLFLARYIVAASGHRPSSWHEMFERFWPFLILYGCRSAWRRWKKQRAR